MRHERIDPAESPLKEQSAWADGVSVCERMSRPAVTVADGATITEALRLMARNRIHYLPRPRRRGQARGDRERGRRAGDTTPGGLTRPERGSDHE